MLIYFVLLITSFFGSFTQSVAGFGSSLIIMSFLPLVLPLFKATAINGIIAMVLNIAILFRYRKDINYKIVVFPAIVSLIVCHFAIDFGIKADTNLLKMIYAIFMIILAIYFIFFEEKVKIKSNKITLCLCAAISGTTTGLFGIGGPPMALYYINCTKNKREYITSLQLFYFMNNIYGTGLRIMNGIITKDIIAYLIFGALATIVGQSIGGKMIDKISNKALRFIIYSVVLCSGIIYFYQCL